MNLIALLLTGVVQLICFLIPVVINIVCSLGPMLLRGLVSLIRLFSGSNNDVKNCGKVGRFVGEQLGGDVGQPFTPQAFVGEVVGGTVGQKAGEFLGKNTVTIKDSCHHDDLSSAFMLVKKFG